MKAFLIRWLRFQREKTFLFIALLAAFLLFAGSIAGNSAIEAFPEFTNVQVQVITQFPGKAAEEIERQVTRPLEVATNGLQGLINQRSLSIFGLSVVTLTFDDNVETKAARLDVSQRLTDVDLPDGVKPSLSPDTTPVGEIFRYSLKGDLPVDELRLIEDWTLEREFKSIPGIADVVSFGGPTRVLSVNLDISRMKALGLSVNAVSLALGQNHVNAGGSVITHGSESFVVRSIGQYERPEDLESAVVATVKNIPVRIRDIGNVSISNRERFGQVGRNDSDDVVEGIILLRQGADTLRTCEAIREKIAQLNGGQLPAGAIIDPYYDRTDLIHRSSHTVFHNILFGIALVCILLIAGFGSNYWALTIGVAAIIPFALLVAFVAVRWCGYTPNLISLGAVDFGIIVETAIFGAEALIRGRKKLNTRDDDSTAQVLADVFGPAFLCALLLLIAFIPILSLQRIEGRIFRPLGITLVAALIGGQIGALIFIPAFSHLAPITSGHSFFERIISRIVSGFEAVGRLLSRIPGLGLISALLFIIVIGLCLHGLGRDFLPNLNEGSLYIRATAPATISREAAVSLAGKMRTQLKEIPEVVDVVTQVGRPDDGTDVNGFDNIESFVALKAPEDWKSGKSIEDFNALAEEKLSSIKGVDFNYSQPIKDNVDEAISGVKGELVIKIFGPNLIQLQSYADKIAAILKHVPGAEDVAAEQLLSQAELRFQMDRDILARYGLRASDAEEVLEHALLGKSAGKLTDEQGRAIDIIVRPIIPEHTTIEFLDSLPVMTPEGAKIPLGDVAHSALIEGVGRVYRELGERRVAVKSSVRNRAVVEFVKEASEKIDRALPLAAHYRLQWSGSFENAARASQQFMIVVPLCVAAMIVILYTWFSNWSMVGLLLWEIPFSAFGGLLGLRLFGLNFSISAAAGGIVLIGISFLTGMMMISQFLENRSAWTALKEQGASILLSSCVAIVGLIPAALSTGIGSETAKPFAVIILGGLISSLLFTLLLLPGLLARSNYGKN